MASILSPKRVKRLRTWLKRRQTAGFTLLELLVAMLIGFLVVIGLLTLVVQLTETNQRDAARSQVQQDMQAALDYIAQDMREAVFVYNGQCLYGTPTQPTDNTNLNTTCPGIVNHIPAEMSQSGRVPVLAFWRTEPLPVAIRNLCAASVTDIAQGRDNALTAAGVPCISGNTYALVVYAVDTNPGATWAGRARLVRYKLSQFTDNATDEGDQSTGYANPLRSAEYTFQQWPYRLEGSAAVNRQTVADDVSDTRPLGTPTSAENPIQTLVDFVDNRGAVIVDANGAVTSGVTPSCDEFVANDQTGNPDPSTIPGALSPPTANNPNNVYGFYACVRGGGVGNSNISGVNQDVVLTIVGNVAGKGGFPKTGNTEERAYRLSPLQTRVLVRGVVRKQG